MFFSEKMDEHYFKCSRAKNANNFVRVQTSIIKASIQNVRISRNKFSAKCFLRDIAIRRFAYRITLNAQKFQEKQSFSDALQLDK